MTGLALVLALLLGALVVLGLPDRDGGRPDGGGVCTPRTVASWTQDDALTSEFARYGDDGARTDDWTGGDGTHSVRLPDGRLLWLFCDTVWEGDRPGLWLGTTAATGPAVPGRVPGELTELPTPRGDPHARPSHRRPGGRSPSEGRARPPQGMLAPPPDLVLPGGGTCQVPDSARPSRPGSGATELAQPARAATRTTSARITGSRW